MSINAVIYRDEGGVYCAYVPAMPGCHSDGLTYEEAVANIREAASLWVEAQEAMSTERTDAHVERISL